MRSGLTEALVTTAGDGATAKVDPGPTDLRRRPERLDDHRQGLPLRHVARRELPDHHLRRHPEHQARDRRGEPGPGREHRAAQPAVVLHRDQRPERRAPRLHGHVRRKRVRDGRQHERPDLLPLRRAPVRRGVGRLRVRRSRRAATTPATRPRSAPSPSSNSTCANTDSTKQPDAMGTQPPTGNSSTPIYEYSADLAGDYLGGLAMMRKGTSCRTSLLVRGRREHGGARTSGRCTHGPRRSGRLRHSTSAGARRCPSGRRPWAACPAEASSARR